MYNLRMTKRTPYQRIMLAADSGRGVRLTAKECISLSLDDAIMTRAQLDDQQAACTHNNHGTCPECDQR